MSRLEYFVQFVPPVFAIYLILVSGLAGRLLAGRIRTFIAAGNDSALKQKSALIQNLVLSGATQISILNSMSAAIISAAVIGRKSFYPTIFALVIIFAIFIALISWMLALDPDDLADKRFSRIPVKYSIGCKAALIAANLILCLVIWLGSPAS
jgi:cation transporter-like permease